MNNNISGLVRENYCKHGLENGLLLANFNVHSITANFLNLISNVSPNKEFNKKLQEQIKEENKQKETIYLEKLIQLEAVYFNYTCTIIVDVFECHRIGCTCPNLKAKLLPNKDIDEFIGRLVYPQMAFEGRLIGFKAKSLKKLITRWKKDKKSKIENAFVRKRYGDLHTLGKTLAEVCRNCKSSKLELSMYNPEDDNFRKTEVVVAKGGQKWRTCKKKDEEQSTIASQYSEIASDSKTIVIDLDHLPSAFPANCCSECTIEVDIIEKHVDGCTHAKSKSQMKHSDKFGSYDVIGRLVYPYRNFADGNSQNSMNEPYMHKEFFETTLMNRNKGTKIKNKNAEKTFSEATSSKHEESLKNIIEYDDYREAKKSTIHKNTNMKAHLIHESNDSNRIDVKSAAHKFYFLNPPKESDDIQNYSFISSTSGYTNKTKYEKTMSQGNLDDEEDDCKAYDVISTPSTAKKTKLKSSCMGSSGFLPYVNPHAGIYNNSLQKFDYNVIPTPQEVHDYREASSDGLAKSKREFYNLNLELDAIRRNNNSKDANIDQPKLPQERKYYQKKIPVLTRASVYKTK